MKPSIYDEKCSSLLFLILISFLTVGFMVECGQGGFLLHKIKTIQGNWSLRCQRLDLSNIFWDCKHCVVEESHPSRHFFTDFEVRCYMNVHVGSSMVMMDMDCEGDYGGDSDRIVTGLWQDCDMILTWLWQDCDIIVTGLWQDFEGDCEGDCEGDLGSKRSTCQN